jgi:outer membrane protein assembly factor BamB
MQLSAHGGGLAQANSCQHKNCDSLQRKWSYATGGDEVDSSPAVANGVLYVGSDYGHTVFALSASTGALLWSYTRQHAALEPV